MGWKGVKKQTNIEDIKSWCEEMGIENYTINSKGEIDVDECVNLFNKDIKELPYKFGTINGFFSLTSNPNLTSLKNCPNIVQGWFSCDYCKNLDSLDGCPKEVSRDFYCRDCKRKFTKEYIRSLCKIKEDVYIIIS